MASKEVLLQVQSILKDAKADVQELLKNEQHLQIGFITKFDLMINKIVFLTGTGTAEAHSAVKKFKPVTNVMGKSVTKAPKLQKADIDPRQQEIDDLRNKVQQLQSTIFERSNEDILESNGNLEIKALAKRAGLEDYKSAKINGAYLDRIRTGLKEQETIRGLREKDAQITAQPTVPLTTTKTIAEEEQDPNAIEDELEA